MYVIVSHTNTDFDSLASMWAAKKLYPQALPVFTGSPEPNVKKFLDDFPEFSPLKERNIQINEVNNMIVVDTPRKKRLANFSFLLEKIRPELLVDHHGEDDVDINAKRVIVKKKGAAVTILLGLLIEKGLSLTSMEATLFALGIYEDTGCFTHSSATEDDFRAMAYLMANGCDVSFVNKYLRTDINKEQFQLLKMLADHLVLKRIEGLPVHFSFAEADSYVADMAAVIQRLKEIHDISILFVLLKLGNKGFLISRAEENTIDCSEIMKYWNGGGHSVSASATLPVETKKEEVYEKIEDLIAKSLNYSLSAKDIMSSPVETVNNNEKVSVARKKIHQLHHNSLLVLNHDGKVLGIIAKNDLEKAYYHKLGENPVSDIMTSDLITISPETSLRTINHFVTSTRQRKYPVLDQGELIGIVTANDILKTFLYPRELKDDSLYSNELMVKQMKEYFSQRIFTIVKELSEIARELDYKIYLVGGIVRDMLMKRDNNEDIDIVVEGDTKKLAERYSSCHGGHYKIYNRFHTATIITKDEIKIDLATARIEFYENPGALPTVSKSSIKYDLYRRDFSINTLAIDLNEEEFGKLIDFFSGRRDIKTKTIRVLHNLSFIEDPTRIIRGVRFAERFNFKIGDQTRKLIESAIKNKMLKRVSPQRIQDELIIILKERNPLRAIQRMEELDVNKQLPARLNFHGKVFDYLESCHAIVDWFSLLFKTEKVDFWKSYLLGVLFFQTPGNRGDFFKSFHFSEKIKGAVKDLVANADTVVDLLNSVEIKDSEVYFLLKDWALEQIIFLLAYSHGERKQSRITRYLTELRNISLKIGGKDLIKAGISPGKIFKDILEYVLKAKIDGEIPNNEELSFALCYYERIKGGLK